MFKNIKAENTSRKSFFGSSIVVSNGKWAYLRELKILGKTNLDLASTPEAPVEIKGSSSKIEIFSAGVNLFDKNLVPENANLGFYKYNNGFTTIKKLTGTRSFVIQLPAIIPKDTKIRISFNPLGSTINRNFWGTLYHTDGGATGITIPLGTGTRDFVLSKAVNAISFYDDAGDDIGAVQYFNDFMITVGEESYSYVPFVHAKNLTIEVKDNEGNSHNLFTLPNDIGDTLDASNIIIKTKKIIIDKNNYYNAAFISSDNYSFIQFSFLDTEERYSALRTGIINGYCNKFFIKNALEPNTASFVNEPGGMRIYVRIPFSSSISLNTAGILTWLNSHVDNYGEIVFVYEAAKEKRYVTHEVEALKLKTILQPENEKAIIFASEESHCNLSFSAITI